MERLARLCSAATRFLLRLSVIASASVSNVHSLQVQHSDEEVDNSRGYAGGFFRTLSHSCSVECTIVVRLIWRELLRSFKVQLSGVEHERAGRDEEAIQ